MTAPAETEERPIAVPVSTAAKRLGFSRQRVYAYEKEGLLKRLPGPGIMMILTESIDELIEQARRGGSNAQAVS